MHSIRRPWWSIDEVRHELHVEVDFRIDRRPNLPVGVACRRQLHTVRASPVGPGPLRRSPSSNERAGLQQEGYRADAEVRRTVRRGEATSRLGTRQVSRTVQSANPGLPVRDCAEPQRLQHARKTYETLFRTFRLVLPDDSPSNRTESWGSSSIGPRHCCFSPTNHSKHLPRSSDKSGVFRPAIDGQKNSAGGSRLTAQIDTSEPTSISSFVACTNCSNSRGTSRGDVGRRIELPVVNEP